MAAARALRKVAVLIGTSLSLLPLLAQPTPVVAATTGTLFGIDIHGPAVVRIDPGTGALTPVADLSLPPDHLAPGFMDTLASDPATHRLFLVRTVDDISSGFPTRTYELVTVDSRGGILSVSSDMGRPVTSLAFDSSAHTLFGLTGDCCPFQVVTVDPISGSLTHIADVPGDTLSFMAFSPSTHSLYVDSESFAAPPPSPPVNTLVSVSTVAPYAVKSSLPLSRGVNSLAFDTALGMLVGVTFFPPHFVSLAPTTGAETFPGSYDFGFFLEPGVALDPATHTYFKVQDVFDDVQGPIAHIASINDQTGAGVLGESTGTNLAALVFETPPITADSIRAGVRGALAGGAIDNAGVAAALLAELNAAAAARSRADCATAANLYNAFINNVTAQSGNHVAATTASQLIGEAQFLVANCP